MTFRGHVEWVESTTPRGFLAGDHILGTTSLSIYGADSFVSSTNAGSVVIDGFTYTYSSVTVSVDESVTPSTLVVSPGLVQAEISGEPIELVSSDETKFAGVSTGDGIGDVMRVRVPHSLKAYSALTDGIRTNGEQETVDVDRVNGELVIANVIGISDVYDASNTPIVTSTAGGERVQIDGDGITLYTNDPVQQLAFTTTGLPIGVAVDAAGYIYVADQTNSKVRKFVADGSQVLTGGFPISVTGGCTSIALDSSGNIYTGGATAVRKFDTSGIQTLTFATTTAAGIAVDTSGNIYVADSVANLIRKYNSAGTAGITISTTGQPLGVAVDASGNIFAPDITNSLVRKFNAAGTQTLSFARTNGNGIAVDAAGDIYVTNYSAVVKYDAAGVAVTGYPFGFGFDGRQTDVAVDAAGNVYAADANNFVIRKYNNPGVVISSGRLISALGRLLALNATIAGNLEVDSISSVNGLQITSPVTMLQKTQGKTDVSVTSGTGTTTVVVVYDVAFLTKPVVNFTPNDAKLSAPTLTASSTSGFTVQWSRSATGTYTFGWTATVPT